MDKIPRHIFQTWKSKTTMPLNMAYWQSTWKKHNPTFEYVLWDDADNRKFIETYYPWFLPKYDSYDMNIKRVDSVRYFYLYHFGGIYADLDFECILPFEQLLLENEESHDVILGTMGDNDAWANSDHSIPNAIMISKPKAPFWLVVIYFLYQIPGYATPESCTGPILLKKAVEAYSNLCNRNDLLNSCLWYQDMVKIMIPETRPESVKSNVKLLESKILYPLNWLNDAHKVELRAPVIDNHEIFDEEKVKNLFPESYAVTYWQHSW